MSTLLIELLTEELPPKALARLGEAFAQSLFDGLSAQGLLEEGAQVEGFATPRRLAASITGVRRAAPDRELREKVLPVNIAFDAEGKPTAPLTKKLAALAKSIGVDTIAPNRWSARRTARPNRCSTATPRAAPCWPMACRPRCRKPSPACRSPR